MKGAPGRFSFFRNGPSYAVTRLRLDLVKFDLAERSHS